MGEGHCVGVTGVFGGMSWVQVFIIVRALLYVVLERWVIWRLFAARLTGGSS